MPNVIPYLIEAKKEQMANRPLNRFVSAFQDAMKTQQEQQEWRLKQEAHKADMYQTLRESGYDPQEATDAVIKGEFPTTPGGETWKEQEYKKRMEKYTQDIEKGALDIEEAKVDIETKKRKLPLDIEEGQKQIDILNARLEKLNAPEEEEDELSRETRERQKELIEKQIENIDYRMNLKPEETDLTKDDQLALDINKARRKEMPWEKLAEKYPTKLSMIEKAQKYYTAEEVGKQPITKTPIKDVGGAHLIARAKKTHASMSPATKKAIDSIKTNNDLIAFVKNADALEEQGVDVDAIQDYYMDEITDLVTKGLLTEK